VLYLIGILLILDVLVKLSSVGLLDVLLLLIGSCGKDWLICIGFGIYAEFVDFGFYILWCW